MPGISGVGEINVAFSKEESSTVIKIKRVQSLIEEEREQEQDESCSAQDMMSFSWQISRGMVSFVHSF